MKGVLTALTLVMLSTNTLAQHAHDASHDAKPPSLMPGLGDVHHPVSTTNSDAQRFFDQGLALVYDGLNTATNVFSIAQDVLSAKIAMAKNDKRGAIELLKKAVAAEDSLNYDEPEDWYIPSKESLGGALMLNGDYPAAEKVFRAELEKHRRNGRALFGLVESLKAQGKKLAAEFVQAEFEAAWKNADTRLRLEDL